MMIEMKAVYYLLLCIAILIFMICIFKRESLEPVFAPDTSIEYIANDSVNYIVTESLKKEYLDDIRDTINDCNMVNSYNKEITPPQMAYNRALEVLLTIYTEEESSLCKPYLINFLDGVWIVRSSTIISNRGLVFGGTFYMEIRKKDGHILLLIIEE